MYSDFGKFLIRLPQGSLQDLISFLEVPTQLEDKMNDPSIREAIFLASPVLDREIQKFIEGKISSEKERKRIKDSFIKYYTRFCTRCTPFGTFATCSYGKIGEATSVINNNRIKRHIQFDTLYLSRLANSISNTLEARKQLLYYTNSSIYSIGSKLRYIEYKQFGARYVHHITSVQKNKYIKDILKKAVNGIKYDDIISILTRDGIVENNAEEYVNDLINNQLLQGELELNLKENNFLDLIYDSLDRKELSIPKLHTIKKFITETRSLFELINKETNPLVVTRYYKKIIEGARSLPIPCDEKHILHIDSELNQPYSAIIGANIIQELKDAAIFFCRWNSLQPDGSLNNFSNAFYEKFEEQEIPLLEALDPDIGVGYPSKHGQTDTSPLLSSINLPHKHKDNRYAIVEVTLLRKLLEAERRGEMEIVLDLEDSANLDNTRDFPNMLSCLFKLVRGESTDLIVEPQFSTSATSGIGRYAYMSKEVENLVKDIAKKEQEFDKNIVYAEIKHVSSTQMGNIANITHIWDYEILLLAGSKISPECKIPISDLMLSRRNGELVIRSRRLNRRIMPVLSSANDFHYNTQPAYQFLADMYYQHKPNGLTFNWGSLQQVLDFLPRVRYKNCVLSLATWIIRKKEISEICGNYDNIENIRKKYKLPRYIYLVDGDNTLLVDFDSKNSLEAFISIIKKRDEIILKETLLDDCKLTNHPIMHECIVPLYKEIK